MKLVTEEMSINEIVKKYPQTSKIFIDYGLFCVGCAASSIETVKQGILGHGIDEDTFKVILEKLNFSAKSKVKKEAKKFEINDNAVKKLVEIKNRNLNLKNMKYLRIKAFGNEEYDFEFTDKKTEKDIIFFREELKIIMDRESFENLQGINIDFMKTEHSEGFVFEKE